MNARIYGYGKQQDTRVLYRFESDSKLDFGHFLLNCWASVVESFVIESNVMS
jgi:hypothetical protein